MITIIVPSIRRMGLQRFVNSISASLQQQFRLIVVSPEEMHIRLPELCVHYSNLLDFGSPSRCLQRAVSVVETDMFTWGTDDGVYYNNALKECVDLLSTKGYKDGIVVKYTEEGPGTFTGALDEYYIAKNHAANRQPGINPEWKTAPVGMFNTAYFRDIGGIDCRFEHLNMNIHDFCYRLQRDGGELYFSPQVVMHCDSNNWGSDHQVLDDAYSRNDLPLFESLYKDDKREIVIDFHNWKNSPSPWRRFV